MPAQWDELEEISRRYDIPVIEDAANAMGSYYKGRPCGTFGDIATLSFNGNKIITTSGGGALICKDEATKKRAVFLATQAKEPYLYYEHKTIGFNYRMSNICAGIGRGQMTVLNDHIRHHKHVHGLYKELLNDVVVQDNPNADFDSNFWLSTILFKKELDTEALCLELDKLGIEARPLWKPMHLQPVFKDAPAYVNGVSEALFKTGICLPSGPYVSDDDVRYIVDCVKEAIS
jgi:dTDP-4-amino-4,6-dideoxygalactose transaminase